MTYLLDTCLLSESVARRPNAGVIKWLQATPVIDCYLSALTIGEIRRGVEKLPDSHERKPILIAWLEQDVLTRFQGRVLGVDTGVMMEWGILTASLERRGRALSLMNSLIASQAIFSRLMLVTRNEKDFHGTGVRIVNPWT